ncbi:GSTM1 [Cervus elaphus hippelaphus]|uniref:Glutathione S-transferase n=1 Tax=Cervus elaphus hippelaphus TaxID=46360 RepID=A0A212CG33_CEREH|nr:GSTM1 [Cervus elaphus hippelaphus]
MAMTLGYWDIRGLAHAIRLLLEYTESNYEEKKYTMGDAPDYDRSQWLNEKFKLGLDFPNGADAGEPGGSPDLALWFFQLPYLIDGAHKLTQSKAILRYIARKHNMCGETEEEKIRMDVLENQAMDTANELAILCYNPEFEACSAMESVSEGSDSCFVSQEKLKSQYLKEIPGKMKLYSEFLGRRPWFAGDKLTYVDFLVYDVLDIHRIFEPKCLDEFPNLKDFVSHFEGLKRISAYMKSSRFLPQPVYSKMAVWGSK